MEIKKNELDDLFLTYYFICGFVLLFSIIGFFLVCFFKEIPGVSSFFKFSTNGMGFIQIVLALVCLIVAIAAERVLRITRIYQDHYGA